MRARVKATGEAIRGTHESMLALAYVSEDGWQRNPDGTLSFEYAGESKLDWDSQQQIVEDGEALYVTEGWNIVKESEIELIEEGAA